MTTSPAFDTEALRARLPRVGSPLAFAVAAGLIFIGVLLRFPLDEIATAPLPPYITLYPGIVVAAFAGGIRVGIAAALASAVIAWMLWIHTSPARRRLSA